MNRLYLLVLLTVFAHLSFAGSRVTMSLSAIKLGASPLTVGVLMSLLAALPILFSVGAGRLIDRIGVRAPMLVAAATVVAGTVLAFAVPRLEVLFAVSCLIGSGFMLFHIAANHAAGSLGGPEDRARNFSVLALGFSTSGFLGPMIAGFAIDSMGHRNTFLLLSAPVLMTLIVLLATRIEVPRHPAPAPGGRPKRIVDLLQSRTLRRTFIVSGLLSMAWDLFTFVVPIHGSRIGLTASTIGLILGTFGSAIFAVRLALPLFVHRVTEWQMLIVAMLSAGACLLAFPLLSGVPLLLALSFLLGIGLGGAQPVLMSLLYSEAPPGRTGEAVGLRTLLLNISQTGMPLLFGALGTALGMAPAFWAMGASLLVGGCFLRKR